MNAFRRVASRISSFGLTTISIAITSFATFPIIISQLGLTTWGKLAFAQSLGLIIATVANWGYQSFGPKLVADLPTERQLDVLFEATRARFFLAGSLFISCCVVLVISRPEDALALCMGVGAYLLNGLTFMWFFQGSDKTSKAFWFEALPKILAMWVSVNIFFVDRSLLAFCCTFLSVSLLGSSISTVKLIGLRKVLSAALTSYKSVPFLRQSWMGASTSGISLVYMAFPTVLIGLIAPSALATYALLERLIRFSALGLSSVTASIQSWILIDRAQKRYDETILKGVRASFMYSIFSGGLFFTALTLFGSLIPDSESLITMPLAVFAALTLSASLTTQILGISFLSSTHSLKYLLYSAMAGALAWLCVGPIGIYFYQGAGAQIALAFAECTVLAMQLISVLRARRTATLAQNVAVE